MIVRRLLVTCAAALGAFACTDAPGPLGPPDADLSAGAAGPSVVGSGHVEGAAGLREFTFHALEGPGGEAGGSFKVVLANGLFFEADVTCLAVDGSTGWVAGRIRDTNAGFVVIGSGSMFYALDGGEGEGAVDIVSLAVVNAAEGADVEFCAERPLALPPLTVSQGNVQVR